MLKLILRPGEQLLSRMKYFSKFFLISMVILIPLGILFVNTIRDLNRDINVAKMEQTGLEYTHTLKDVLFQIQIHRGLTVSFLNGNTAFKEKIDQQQKMLEQSTSKMDELDKMYADALEIEGNWPKIKEIWLQLKKDSFTISAADSFKRHTALIKEILNLMKETGNNSEMVLDATLSGHYLVSGVLQDLPLLSEKLGQLRALSSQAVTSGISSLNQRVELIALMSEIKSLLEKINNNNLIITDERLELKPRINAKLEPAKTSIQDLLQYINNEVIAKENITIAPGSLFDQATKTIDSVGALIDESSLVLKEHVTAQYEQKKTRLYLISGAVGLAVFILFYLYTAFFVSVQGCVRKLKENAELMARGDLTGRVHKTSSDELGSVADAFNEMAKNMESLISNNKRLAQSVADISSQLADASHQTGQTSTEVANAVTDLAHGAVEQTELAGNIVEMVNQIKLALDRSAQEADKVAQDARHSTELAHQGTNAINTAVTHTDRVTQAVASVSAQIQELGRRSQEIGSIVEIIASIASQTNLLALNAAIEAARAGEQGRGFAVVAEEVRKLAEQSAGASNQINELIKEVQKQTLAAVNEMEASQDLFNEQVKLIHQGGDSLSAIVRMVEKTGEEVESIKDALHQLDQNATQVATSTEGISKIITNSAAAAQQVAASAQEQSATTQEIAASATDLEDVAAKLLQEVSVFKVSTKM